MDNLDSKLNNQVAILICGHGSRNKLAISEFQELTKLIQKRYPNILVEFGFLEFAKPSIVDALDKLKDNSIKKSNSNTSNAFRCWTCEKWYT